jgi:hypothetical protein
VLQRASAIGRSFTLEMLVALGPDGPDPVPALQQAEDTGVLLRRAGDEWMFAHVLLAQAAYHSVLRKTRETLHAQIVDFLQTRYPQRMAHDPALPADHQLKARQTVPAIRSYLAASQAAMLQGSFADAEAHAKRALGLCPDIAKDIDPVDLEIECHTVLGSILMQVQGFTAEPVRAAFDAVHDIARAQPNLGADSAAAIDGSFTHAVLSGDRRKADAFTDLLARLADIMPDDDTGVEVRLAALTVGNSGGFYQGDFQTQFNQIAQIRQLYRIEKHAAMIPRYGMDIFTTTQMFEAPAVPSVARWTRWQVLWRKPARIRMRCLFRSCCPMR